MSFSTGTRLTLKINLPQLIRSCGWSENYDLGYPSITLAVGAMPQIQAVIRDRINCLGIGAILVEALLTSFSQPINPGDAPARRSTFALPLPETPAVDDAYNKAFPSGQGYDADYGTTVLLINAQTDLGTTPIYRRSVWLAGLPDLADVTLQLKISDPLTQAAVTKFLGDLDNSNSSLGGKNGFAIRSIDRSAGNPILPCTAWVGAAPVVFTVPAHGLVKGQPIQAEGCTVASGGTAPRGRYLVSVVVDADHVQLAGLSFVSAPIHTGGFRKSIVTFNTVTNATIEGMTKRNKGRPSGLARGRRPKVRTLRA